MLLYLAFLSLVATVQQERRDLLAHLVVNAEPIPSEAPVNFFNGLILVILSSLLIVQCVTSLMLES